MKPIDMEEPELKHKESIVTALAEEENEIIPPHLAIVGHNPNEISKITIKSQKMLNARAKHARSPQLRVVYTKNEAPSSKQSSDHR